ncbi:MAG TPA: class I SAM-dependent rRNA methyltransferase [Polyangiaceae bacterium]|nr:class I SAM-dependent rRNA methyltransferase [Polyangiaceae bacterium]
MPTVHLKPGHVQPVWAGHPWVYAQAVDRVEGGATAGDEVRVVDPRGNLLGRGFYSPGSAIVVRVLVRDDKTRIDGRFFHERVARADAWRKECDLPGPETNGYRLVHAEGDDLPGLVVDRFDDVLCVQFTTFGMKLRESLVLQALLDVVRPKTIIDRTTANAAKAEAFEPGRGVVLGEPATELSFLERRLRYAIPLELGQKTGFYFDQRSLRARVESLAKGKRVLDAYSFVGPFSLAAARGGAKEVVAVDESVLALEIAAECAKLNGLGDRIRFVRADARQVLGDTSQHGFDLVLLDPPRLAPSRGAKEAALVAYTKLAEMGCRAVRPGGIVALSSCSAAIDMHALTRALATGALRANREAIVFERHFQGPDHPVLAAHGEGLYLKSLLARIEPRTPSPRKGD